MNNFQYILKILEKYDFIFQYEQTGRNLPILTFMRKNDELILEFDDYNDDNEIEYENILTIDYPVYSIELKNNSGFSYSSDITDCESLEDGDELKLSKNELQYLEKCLDICYNKKKISYHLNENAKERIIFASYIQQFENLFDDFNYCFQNCFSTAFSSINRFEIIFSHKKDYQIRFYFCFNPLTFKHYLIMQDCDNYIHEELLNVNENMIRNQIDVFLKNSSINCK